MNFNDYLKEVDRPFHGWDFSYITGAGRMQSGLLPWSYGSMARNFLHGARAALDMGTGGGEFLEKLLPFPLYMAATEGYAPNYPLAKERLEPHGVTVVPVENDTLPFENARFDLVLNQHDSYDLGEVKRVLKPGGIFLTQQVGGVDCSGINDRLEVPVNDEYAKWSLETAEKPFLSPEWELIASGEAHPTQRFYDIGALIYYLKAIPWQVPDFTVEKYREELLSIHKEMSNNKSLDVRQHRFFIAARLL